MAPIPEPNTELVTRTRWYLRLRWFLVAALGIPTFASTYLGSSQADQRGFGLFFITLLLASNIIFYILSRMSTVRSHGRVLAAAVLTMDALLVTFFIYMEGGIESRSQLLYSMPILVAASFFGRAGVYAIAVGSAGAYDFVVIGNYLGWLHSPQTDTNLGTDTGFVVNTLVFFTAAIILVGVLTDFLTRLLIQKEQEATTTAAALRRAQEIAQLGSWEWDVTTDTITWSDELCAIFGITRGVPIDFQGFLKLIHPADQQRVASTITRSLKNHKPFSFDHRIVRPDKTVRALHGEGKIVMDRHGKVIQLYGTSRDVTAELALESAKGDFVALASHQLRTPASGVRMLLAMLRDGYSGTLTSDQLTAVEEAYLANERMLRISDDLLNVAKLESGRLVLNKRQVELCWWLKNVTAPHKLLAKEHRQKLRITVPRGVLYMQVDPERLAMVIDNLLSNARKYTPTRGNIGVTLQPGKRVHKIVVTDSGSGMTRAEIARLFGKFTRLDNPASKGAEGTGLGLYLAKSIVDLHGGSIRVRSKPGQGSTFTVTLPATLSLTA